MTTENPPSTSIIPPDSDSSEELKKPAKTIAGLLQRARKTVIVAGAGVSTAANIPDFRGPDGLYNKNVDLSKINIDFRTLNPTKSHLIIRELLDRGVIDYLISQNCDGLFLRAGVAQNRISEIHGNMYIEFCYNCFRQVIRPYDVSFNSKFRQHETPSDCPNCRRKLKDTIIHEGEKTTNLYPHNFQRAADSASSCDLMIFIGTSGVVIKEYKQLYNVSAEKVIINDGPTPIDNDSKYVVRGKCDDVFTEILKELNLDGLDESMLKYCGHCDPVLNQPKGSRKLDFLGSFTRCTCAERPPKNMLVINPSTARYGIPAWMMNSIKRRKTIESSEMRECESEESSHDSDDSDFTPDKEKKSQGADVKGKRVNSSNKRAYRKKTVNSGNTPTSSTSKPASILSRRGRPRKHFANSSDLSDGTYGSVESTSHETTPEVAVRNSIQDSSDQVAEQYIRVDVENSIDVVQQNKAYLVAVNDIEVSSEVTIQVATENAVPVTAEIPIDVDIKEKLEQSISPNGETCVQQKCSTPKSNVLQLHV
ncbi:unnamed protein product [Caenorhabditis bovis]|uniref:Regulatory protein SIR2 homolog 7 n=1 Tax=Caenorhabditis bovis TaxID=2654633 RepID=A0A8S1EJE6_9PELO|nr:unnamed protein product [Caenorhabditis bovis]